MTQGSSEQAGLILRLLGRLSCTPKGIRTPVAGLKGLSPSPLDDGGVLDESTRESLTERNLTGQIWRSS